MAAREVVMSRFAWLLCMVCLSGPAFAQGVDPGVPDVLIASAQPPSLPVSAALRAPAARRPPALVPLYGSFAALQIADYASTRRALASGAGRESNPVMEPLIGNAAAFLTLKVASTAGIIWAGEKLWRKNRVGAVVFMAAANGALAVVAAHNYSIAAAGRR